MFFSGNYQHSADIRALGVGCDQLTAIMATTVTFNGISADGSATQTTTQLTLIFNQAIPGLSADDIYLSGVPGVSKGSLSGSGSVYTLPISGFTGGGILNVAVAKTGYTINGSPQTVPIYYYTSSGGNDIAVIFTNLTADGSASQTTTQLTLTFKKAITGLSASDITLSGVSGVNKGSLSGSGSIYTLPINGFSSGGTLSVIVAKTGYTINGSPQTVTIYYKNGSNNSGTLSGTYADDSGVTLTFSGSNYSISDNGQEFERGSYSVTGSTVRFTPTWHIENNLTSYTGTISGSNNSTIIWWGITFIKGGNNSGALSGTYVEDYGSTMSFTFSGSNYTKSYSEYEIEKGSYSVTGSTVRFTPTWHDDPDNDLAPYTGTISGSNNSTITDEWGNTFIKR